MITPKVMIVDDEAEFLEALAGRLSLRGFDMVRALDGARALEALDADPNIEVVILDIQMPGPTGHEVLDSIKNRRPLVEVIILTGHGSVALGVECMKRGAFDFQEKSASIDKLADMAENAAHRHRRNQNMVVSIRSRYKKPSQARIDSLDPFVRKALGYE